MKLSEVSQLLGAIAATDNRTVGDLDVQTWAAILPPDMPLAAAQAAVIQHRRESSDWLTPKHIIDAVGLERRERLQRAGDPPMPGDLTWAQEREWRQLWAGHVKDGLSRDDAAKVASRQMALPSELEKIDMPDYARKAITAFARDHSVPAVKP